MSDKRTDEQRAAARERQLRALDLDERSRVAFKTWQAQRDPVLRAEARDVYEALDAEQRAAWALSDALDGADPIVAQLAAAQRLEDAKPNPDDPDDD